MWRRSAGRGRRAAGTALVAVVLLLLAGEPSPTPSGTDSGLSSVVATCSATSAQATQVVRCEVEGAPSGVVLRLTVRTGEGEDEALWPGTTTAGSEPTTVETAIPCDVAGTAMVTVATETSTDSFRHREDVELVGACQPPWQLSGEQWARAAASVLVAVTLVLVLSVRRRERRRHRGPRHPGPRRRFSGRHRRRRHPASGRGRPRSRRSRTRRR